jgi:DNA polymerase-3 subunit beta
MRGRHLEGSQSEDEKQSSIESLIAKTKFAISMEASRYTLNGGLLILKPDTLAVATDGHRLALAETDQKLAGLNGEARVLIRKKAMDEVEKLSNAAGSDALHGIR